MCTIRPSRIHRFLLLLVSVGSWAGIVTCTLPAPLQAVGVLLVAFWATHQWKELNRHRIIVHHGGQEDIDNHWTLETEGCERVTGALIADGYRSAGLLLFVIQVSGGRKVHRVPIWRDSVSAIEFSYLNLQLLFNTSTPDTH